MTKINEVIPPMPDAPDSTTDTKSEFNVKADTFVKAWTPHTTSINTWATEANAVATEINSVVASLPVGTIDDANLSATSAFSNQHVHDTYVPKSDYIVPPELQAFLAAGNPMPSWGGSDYTDTYAIGTSPTAKIYPDGTVVGKTSNGSYTRSPDGSLTATGTAKLKQLATYQHVATTGAMILPIPSTVEVTASTNITNPPSATEARQDVIAYTQTTLTTVSGMYTASSGTDLSTMWGLDMKYMAVGRWK